MKLSNKSQTIQQRYDQTKSSVDYPQEMYDVQSLVMLSKKIEQQRQVYDDENSILLQKVQVVKNDDITKNRYAVLFQSRILLFKTQGYYEVGSLAMSVYPLLRCTVRQSKEKLILQYQVNNKNSMSMMNNHQNISQISDDMNFDISQSSEKILIFPDSQTAQIWYSEISNLIQNIERKLNRHRKLTLSKNQNDDSEDGFMGLLKKFLWGMCCDMYPKNLNTRYSIYQVTLEGLYESTVPYFSIDTQPSQLSSENFILSQNDTPRNVQDDTDPSSVMFKAVSQPSDVKKYIIGNRISQIKRFSMIKEDENERSFNNTSEENNIFRDDNSPLFHDQSTRDQDQVVQYSYLIEALAESKLGMLEDVQKVTDEEYSPNRYEQEYKYTLRDYYQKISSKDFLLKTSAPERVFEIVTYFIEEQKQQQNSDAVIRDIVMNIIDNFEESLIKIGNEIILELKKFQIPQNQKSFSKLLIKNNMLLNDIREFYEIYDEWQLKYPSLIQQQSPVLSFGKDQSDMIFERKSNRNDLQIKLEKLLLIDELRFETVLFKQNIQILKLLKQF